MNCVKLMFFFLVINICTVDAAVQVGVDCLFSPSYKELLQGKKIGLITNHTGIDSRGCSTIDLFKQYQKEYGYSLVALFAPEHGLRGDYHAEKSVADERDSDGIPVFSLHGVTRRPTSAMLKDISLLVFDIQDVGSRSYTYTSTLFYAMEEAAKAKIPVVVLDRPNPLGAIVDGPMLEEKWRSFVGYVNVPYCHGMTVGELAQFFNGEYQVGCQLTVIPMKEWKRWMVFKETGLTWIPTSPQIPDAETAFFYPTTGLLGELQIVNIGVGYTLPFRVVGAPWINAEKLAQYLNEQKNPGVHFHPFHYTPFFGRFAGQSCHGVLIVLKAPSLYLPVTTQYALLAALKALYPAQFQNGLEGENEKRLKMFHTVNGTKEVYRILKEEPYVFWKLRAIHQKERSEYLRKRELYLISQY